MHPIVREIGHGTFRLIPESQQDHWLEFEHDPGEEEGETPYRAWVKTTTNCTSATEWKFKDAGEDGWFRI